MRPEIDQLLQKAEQSLNEGDYGASPAVRAAEVEEILTWADDLSAAARQFLAQTCAWLRQP